MATQTTIRALQLIRDNSISSPREFAYLMWPDNPAWSRLGKSGHGQAHGVGMRLAGGGYLGRLRSRGLITYSSDPIRLTDQGRLLLEEASKKETEMLNDQRGKGNPPDCPDGHGPMQYLSHLPWIIQGKADIHNPDARAIMYGCVTCGKTVKVATGNPEPKELTPEPVWPIIPTERKTE